MRRGLAPLVLCYHSIADVSRNRDPHMLTVSRRRFRSQVELLRSRGYGFVKAVDFATRLHAGEDLRNVCALTFDDGISDNAHTLPAIAEELDVVATLFVCGGLLGGAHPDYPPGSARMMTVEELRDVAALPFIEIGSHTDTHVELDDASEQDAYRSMAQSRETLEHLLGSRVSSFAYPRGGYSSGCPRAAERAGYAGAFTCGPDLGAWRRYEIPRVIVESWDRRLSFEAKVRGLLYPAMSSRPGGAARRVLRSIRALARG